MIKYVCLVLASFIFIPNNSYSMKLKKNKYSIILNYLDYIKLQSPLLGNKTYIDKAGFNVSIDSYIDEFNYKIDEKLKYITVKKEEQTIGLYIERLYLSHKRIKILPEKITYLILGAYRSYYKDEKKCIKAINLLVEKVKKKGSIIIEEGISSITENELYQLYCLCKKKEITLIMPECLCKVLKSTISKKKNTIDYKPTISKKKNNDDYKLEILKKFFSRILEEV